MKQRIEINIPSSLSDITVEQYTQLKRIELNEDIGILYKTLGILCGLRRKEVNLLPLQIIEEVFEKATSFLTMTAEPVLRFEVGGVTYGRIPNMEKTVFAEFLDLNHYINPLLLGEKPDLDLAYNFMAVMYRPVTDSKGDKYLIEDYQGSAKYAEIMKKAPAAALLSSQVFFCNLRTDVLKTSTTYLQKVLESPVDLEKISTTSSVGMGQLLSSLVGTISTSNGLLKRTHLPHFSSWISRKGRNELLTLRQNKLAI